MHAILVIHFPSLIYICSFLSWVDEQVNIYFAVVVILTKGCGATLLHVLISTKHFFQVSSKFLHGLQRTLIGSKLPLGKTWMLLALFRTGCNGALQPLVAEMRITTTHTFYFINTWKKVIEIWLGSCLGTLPEPWSCCGSAHSAHSESV